MGSPSSASSWFVLHSPLGPDCRLSDMLQQTAYVMQDDALLGNLTVFETLMFTLKLRLPSGSLTKQEMEERALAIIADLNLGLSFLFLCFGRKSMR